MLNSAHNKKHLPAMDSKGIHFANQMTMRVVLYQDNSENLPGLSSIRSDEKLSATHIQESSENPQISSQANRNQSNIFLFI